MADRDEIYERLEGFVTRDVAGETILVPMRVDAGEMEYIIAMNPVAAHIWKSLDGTTSVAGVVASLCAGFDVDEEQARTDVHAFLQQLVEAGLVREV